MIILEIRAEATLKRSPGIIIEEFVSVEREREKCQLIAIYIIQALAEFPNASGLQGSSLCTL